MFRFQAGSKAEGSEMELGSPSGKVELRGGKLLVACLAFRLSLSADDGYRNIRGLHMHSAPE